MDDRAALLMSCIRELAASVVQRALDDVAGGYGISDRQRERAYQWLGSPDARWWFDALATDDLPADILQSAAIAKARQIRETVHAA